MKNLSPLLLSLSGYSNNSMEITQLARFAVKGFSGDLLQTVNIQKGDITFPDDRRYALMKVKENSNGSSKETSFDPNDPSWLHKENFICAFTEPELMASFISQYEIKEPSCGENTDFQRLFTLYDRKEYSSQDDPSDVSPLLGPIDLNKKEGRDQLSMFFMRQQLEKDPLSTAKLICATQTHSKKHKHQFGNTTKGVKKNNGDTRTIHIINEATVREVEDAINAEDGDRTDMEELNQMKIKLNAMRFRPNIVVDGLEPWKEFDLVGKKLRLIRSKDDHAGNDSNPINIKVLDRTVRCEGVGIDPTDPQKRKLNIPQLLSKNFPQHGPYLGVYAVIEPNSEGTISIGDRIELVENDDESV